MTNHPNPQGKKAASKPARILAGKHDHRAANQKSANWIVPLVLAVFVAGTMYWVVSSPATIPAPQTSTSPADPAQSSLNSSPVADHEAHSAMAPATASDPASETIPSYFASAEAAQPYPATVPPQQFPNPVIAHAYRVAREIPGTLAQQPCYCACYRTAGHRGLLDCFASLHGAACSVCIQEALLAEKLQKEGRSASQIREAIIRGDWQSVALN